MRELLTSLLHEISSKYVDQPTAVMAAWPSLVGPKLAPMTEVVRFEEGIMVVKVKNSTLYSLLEQQEKGRLLNALRKQFPKNVIKALVFKLG